jgi:peptide/nickel transport system substrate-binding protein
MTVGLGSGFLALLMSCSGGESAAPTDAPKPAPTSPVAEGPRDTLVVASQSDIGTLISVVQQSNFDGNILANLTFPTVDVTFDCSLKKAPALAKSWQWNEDGTVLSMELRDDVKWADGTPVTPEDIAFTYDLVGDPAVASTRYDFVERMTPDGRPKIIDPTHIEWHFTQPYDRDTQMSHASLELVPKHLFSTADRGSLRGNDKANTPLSYGPFRIAKWEPNQQLVLEPNPDFTGPAEWKAHLNRVIFRVIPEYATRLLELESGNVDFMEAVRVQDADRLRESHPEIRLVRRGWRTEDYIGWNLQNPLFQDVNVRKALAMAVDVDDMIGKLLTSKSGEAYARRSVGTITPALCGVHNDDIVPIQPNVDKAKQMLAEAGWRDTDADGILDKSGKKFEFTLLTNTGNSRRSDAAVLFQAKMKDVGVSVNLQQVESNTMFERERKHDFDAVLSGWAAGLFVDPSPIWHCNDPSAKKEYQFNFTGYCNPEVDKLIEQGLATPNPKDSAPIWKDLQAKVYADQPYLFLWWMDEIDAINDRFEDTTIDVLSPYDRLWEWEVPADKVKYKN